MSGTHTKQSSERRVSVYFATRYQGPCYTSRTTPNITMQMHVQRPSISNGPFDCIIGLSSRGRIRLTITAGLSPRDKGVWTRSFALIYNWVLDRVTDLRNAIAQYVLFQRRQNSARATRLRILHFQFPLWPSALPPTVASQTISIIFHRLSASTDQETGSIHTF
jgi:hypothetical protein